MNALLIQIGDIHLRATGNQVVGRIEAVRRALQAQPDRVDVCVLVIVGDIANTASAEEYAVAHQMLDALHAELAVAFPNVTVEEVFVPGNHDCLLPTEQMQLRELVTSQLLSDASKRTDTSSASLVRNVLEAQLPFRTFVSERRGRSSSRHTADQPPAGHLVWTDTVEVGGETIRFLCLNTAWLSQRREKSGHLLAPVWFVEKPQEPATVSIALFHHPYTWLEPGNAKDLRRIVDELADVAMTGHEHEAYQYSAQSLEGNHSEYYEGAVFQDGSKPESGFNTLIIDTDKRQARYTLFHWVGDHYAPKHRGEWRSFQSTRPDSLSTFTPSESFLRFLDDPGIKLTHRRKSNLTLADIFVQPDLEERSITRRESTETIIRGPQVAQYIREHGKVLLLGDELCGRSTLAKTLWLEFSELKTVPVLIAGQDLRSYDDASLRRVVSQAVSQQYGPTWVERFWQLDASQRVIIVDDLHRSKLNRRGTANTVNWFIERFTNVVLFVNHIFELEEVTQGADDPAAGVLLQFKCCTIRPFGHRLRHLLIEKWHLIGSEYTANEDDTAQATRESEKVINTVLGKNAVPSNPFFVLSILQMQEAGVSHHTPMGAYGHHYQAFITTALDEAIRKHGSSILVGTVYAFVGQLAYTVFESRDPLIDAETFARIANEYRQRMKMRFSDEQMLSILQHAHILTGGSGGILRFQYPYCYYYFAARHIDEGLKKSSFQATMRGLINSLIEHLHVEEYANILVFLTYFTKDESTIEAMLARARGLYINQDPCDIDKHIAFADKLTGKPLPELHIDTCGAKKNREEYLERLDSAEEQQLATLEGQQEVHAIEAEEQQADDLLQINTALKTIQVMGQILRNFPGELEGDLKKQVASECYLLGLRTLRVIYSLIEEHIQEFRVFFAGVIREVEGIEDDQTLFRATDDLLHRIVFSSSYWMIKSVSQSVGSEQLVETYEEIDRKGSPLSMGLIDLSIRLDHFRNFPSKQLDELLKEMTTEAPIRNQGERFSVRARNIRKPFAYALLRQFVRDHLYLYPVDRVLRESICSKLDIRLSDARMLGSADKALPNKNN